MASAKAVKLSDREVTRIARALAEPRRLQILKQIGGCGDGALACRFILEKQDIAPATLSHHLKELESCGLIEISRRGKFIDVTFCRPTWEAYLAELKNI